MNTVHTRNRYLCNRANRNNCNSHGLVSVVYGYQWLNRNRNNSIIPNTYYYIVYRLQRYWCAQNVINVFFFLYEQAVWCIFVFCSLWYSYIIIDLLPFFFFNISMCNKLKFMVIIIAVQSTAESSFWAVFISASPSKCVYIIAILIDTNWPFKFSNKINIKCNSYKCRC